MLEYNAPENGCSRQPHALALLGCGPEVHSGVKDQHGNAVIEQAQNIERVQALGYAQQHECPWWKLSNEISTRFTTFGETHCLASSEDGKH